MNLVQVIILSVIEGITEFLPISSTGHLILTSRLLGVGTGDFVKTFEIAIQLGAIMSVVVLYFKRFITSFEIYKRLFVAFIPTAVIGFILYPLVKGFLLGSSLVTLLSLFLGGIFIILFEKYFKEKKVKKLSLSKYFLIGVFQSMSIIPGVSRALATIFGGMYVGMKRSEATEFSFLLAVPTMFAATLYDLYKSRDILTSQNLSTLVVGFVLAFIFAMGAVKFLINYVKKNNFKAFGIYRIILSLLYGVFMGF